MVVSHTCRDPAALCLDFLILSHFLFAQTLYQLKMWLSDVLRMSTVFVVRLGTAGTSDSTFKFTSL